MADNYRRPTDSKHETVSFSIQADGQTYSGTITPTGKQLAFGVPNAFIVRIPGRPSMNITIYMGKWVMQGSDEFVNALGSWIKSHYA